MEKIKKCLPKGLFSISVAVFLLFNIKEMQEILPIGVLAVGAFVTVLFLPDSLFCISAKNKLVYFVAAFLSATSGGFFYGNISAYEEKIMALVQPVLSKLNITDITALVLIFAVIGSALVFFFAVMAINLLVALIKNKSICDSSKSTKMFYIITLVFSFLLVLSISNITPLNNATLKGDEAIFSVMGNGWANGKLPYTQLFDHKGPIIFLIYAISWYVTKSNLLVLLLLVLCFWVSIVIGYSIVKKYSNFQTAVACSVIMMFYIVLTQGMFAITEIFCLPLLMLSMYFTATYFTDSKEKHSLIGAFIYGAAIAVCFCTRLTNGVIVCAGALAIFIDLISKKSFKNLFANLISGFAGIACVVLPFIIYFGSKKMLYDFIYGTILYNFAYATADVEVTVEAVFKILYLLSPIVIVNIVAFKKKPNKFLWMFIVLSGILATYVVAFGRLYVHYYLILCVYIPLLFVMLSKKSVDNKCETSFVLTGAGKKAALCSVVAVLGLYCVAGMLSMSMEKDSSYLGEAKEQAELIPQEDRESVIGYGVGPEWYLKTQILPCGKYFVLQDFQSSQSDDMLKENVEFYSSGTAKWVVVKDDIKFEEIENAINNNYDLVDYREIGDETLALYKRN